MFRSRARSLPGIFAVGLVLLLVACGGDGSDQPAPAPTPSDFSLSVPATVSMAQGASGSVAVTIGREGDPGEIALALSGSPLLSPGGGSGKIGYAFTPSAGGSDLTLTVGSDVPVDDYDLTVTGTAGSLRHSVPFTLTVTAGQHSFTISAPESASIIQGGVITLAVTVGGDGFAGGVFDLSTPANLNLSDSARLYGDYADEVGYSFDSVSSQGGNLTLYVGRDIPTGDYPLTVTGSANGEAHAAALTLHVLGKGIVYEIWPTGYGTYQDNLKNLQPGDVLVLHEGTYPGYAFVDLDGTREKPVTIRGYGQGEAKPVLEYTGASHNHWEIHGSHLIVRGLEFDTPNVYSIRIRPPASGGVDNVTLVNNTFVGCGGGCVSANDSGATYRNIRMIDNLMLDAHRTPVYIGNHQGNATFHNFLFEGNVIDGRLIVDNDVVGYGIEVKLNVENAVLRHNYIVGTKGPGIMTYGLESDKPDSHRAIVEGNIVIDACEARSILLGAGPVIARNNLAMGGHFTGYGISDYGGRHLSAGIQVLNNTALLNEPYGFWIHSVSGTGLENLRMVDNLAYPPAGGAGYGNLPPDTDANEIHGNDTQTPTAEMAASVEQLKGLIPSAQDLKQVWPLLSQGRLEPSELMNVLDLLASLPNQSGNTNPRSCP
ncbi:MAG: right-handed parallel beta-helix repeat-containing protein [Gammaproteobacteria bacterium]|nr:right-handed parallel beta-helix repeat-containing protein [Gammaproteobacteria bacterium]